MHLRRHIYTPHFSSTSLPIYYFFFFNDTATTEIYTLSLHDALPISFGNHKLYYHDELFVGEIGQIGSQFRSEEHTSELQSRRDLVCRLLLEKKKKSKIKSARLPRTLRSKACCSARHPGSATEMWTTS